VIINSKFRDYYDSAVGQGIDKTVVFEREIRVIKSKDFFLDTSIAGSIYFHPAHWKRWTKEVKHQWMIIGFCGKTYVILIEKVKQNESEPETIEYFYGEDALKQVFKNKRGKWLYPQTLEFIKKWHNREFLDFFFKQNVPIFLVEPTSTFLSKSELEVILNPSLSEFKFFRLFDAYTAFQEIQMFISGVLGVSEREILQINNKDKIQQFGFDPKWSFRNPDPPKRKQK
jgi:hypothetical protein